MNRLFAKIFGQPFDEMLKLHYCQHEAFIKGRDAINEWRNVIVHRGVPLDQIWPKQVRNAAPDIALEFVRECWDVFRVFNNELIHKPYWQITSSNKPHRQQGKQGCSEVDQHRGDEAARAEGDPGQGDPAGE